MKWEYYWLTHDWKKKDMDRIDKLGLQGWELIGIYPVHEGNLKFVAVLKKRVGVKQQHEMERIQKET